MAEGFRIATAYVEVHARGQDAVGREVRDGVQRDRTFEQAGQESGSRFGRAFALGLERGGLLARIRTLGTSLASALVGGMTSAAARLGGLLASGLRLATVAAGFATVGAAAASAAGFITSLAGALLPVSGLLAALPGAAGVAAAAFGTLKLALNGVGQAFADALSGDYNTFINSKALAAASAAVQNVAYELFQMAPAFKGIKYAAQEALFGPLVDQMWSLLPALNAIREGAAGVAGAFGQAALRLLDFARASETIDAVRAIFGSTQRVIEGLSPALRPLLDGFRDLAVVGAGWLADLAPGMSGVIARFGEFMSRAAASGQALGWMNTALDVLKQLGAVAADAGGILAGVFKAAATAGTGALGIVGQLLDRLNAFVNSAAGQQMLVTVFQALHQVGLALVPIVGAIGAALTLLAPVVAQIATAMGPVLTSAVRALAPALAALGPGILAVVGALGTAVRILAPALTPIATAISGVLKAAAPLIPIAAQIATILAGVLVGALKAIAPAFVTFGRALEDAFKALGPGVIALVKGLATTIASLAPSLKPLGQAIGDIFTTLRPLIASIGPAIAALLPGIATFAKSFAVGIAAFAPALKPLGEALSGILTALSPLLPMAGALAELIAHSLADGIKTITPGLTLMVGAFNQVMAALAPLIPQLINIAAVLINDWLKAFAPILPILGQLAAVVGQFLVDALGLFAKAIEPLLPALSQVAQVIDAQLVDAFKKIAPLLLNVIDQWVRMLPSLAPLLPLFADLVTAYLPVFVKLLEAILPHSAEMARLTAQVVEKLLPMAPTIAGLLLQLAPFAMRLAEIALSISEKLLPAAEKMIPVVANAVEKVVDAFMRLYDALFGHSIIPDLIHGFEQWLGGLPGKFAEWFGRAKEWAVTKLGELLDWVRGLPGKILEALGNLGGLLFNSGRSIIQGMIDGLWSMFSSLWNTAQDILGRIRNLFPFSPAKEGPFSGQGWTLYSGRALGEGFAQGIEDRTPLVRSAAQVLAEQAAPGGQADGGPAVAGQATSGRGGITFTGPVTIPVSVVPDLSRPDMGTRDFLQAVREGIRKLEVSYS